MTLIELKDIIKQTSLKHIRINSFDYGENWEEALSGRDNYPQIFLEMPIIGSIDRNRKNYSFALVCFMYIEEKGSDFEYVSLSDEILNQIITKLSDDNKNFNINLPFSSTTFFDVTTDELSGTRADLTISILNERCVDDNFEN